MAIFIGEDTRVLVQGMTGRSGTFYSDAAMRYGSTYVAGVRPGKGGGRHLGLPLFDTVAEAKSATGANASLVVVPAHGAASAILEAIEAEIGVVVCVTERVPVHDMVNVKAALKGSATRLIGANSQGILVPGVCKIGVMSTADASPGCIGIASRSASLTSELVAQTTKAGLGQSTTVGIGGDPIHGIGFVDCLDSFKDDPGTKGVILIGELGGNEEEQAAAYLSGSGFGKPVASIIVGRHAPPERRMGHAGALSVIGAGSVERKVELLREAGSIAVRNPDDVAAALKSALKGQEG